MLIPSWRILSLISGCLFLISLGIYTPSLEYDFLSWDTYDYLQNTPMIRALTWQNLAAMLTSLSMFNWHPVTWFSYAIDYAIYGLNPWGFHLSNLLLHSANSVLFFFLCLRLLNLHLRAQKNSSPEFVKHAWLSAALAALWFGIHPQHVESVVWIAERKDVLFLFFSLLSLIAYLRYCETRSPRTHIWTFLCCLLAVMSKPMAVSLPLIFLLLDIYPLQRSFLNAPSSPESIRKLLLEKLPFALCSVLSMVLTLIAQRQVISTFEYIPLEFRVLNALNSLLLYLSKFLIPFNFSPLYPLDLQLAENPMAFVAALAGIMLTLWAFYAAYKRRFVGLVLWLFYVITLLPVLGLLQVGIQAAADRYAYLPTLPFYLLLATLSGIGIFHHHKMYRILSSLGVLLFSATLVLVTLKQSETWRNDYQLWAHVVKFSPNHDLAQLNLGKAHYQRGNFATAREHYQIALAHSSPRSRDLIKYYLAQTALKQNDLQTVLDIYLNLTQYRIQIGVPHSELFYWIGKIYAQQGNLLEARAAIEQAVALDPKLEAAQDLLRQLPPLMPAVSFSKQ
ncbi:MAG: tetratricopeptide repeat protein [Thiotrichaceae bacterium]|nr:tetratricopeptide repeat protein [Thiotrichaceae bacterium]